MPEQTKQEVTFNVEVRNAKNWHVGCRTWFSIGSMLGFTEVQPARERLDSFLNTPIMEDGWEARIVRVTKEVVE